MPKFDWKRDLKDLYHAPVKTPSFVEVPEMGFLMIDGQGNPNTVPEFRDAVEALYGLSYTLKFSIKRANPGDDFKVMPLEGLWWMAGGGPFNMETKEEWRWTLMIGQADVVTADRVVAAQEELRTKRSSPALADVRFERWCEGAAAQILHVGPYDAEAATLEKLHEFVREHGRKLHGKHHEIYLSDPRRCAPEKLKTILRHPVTSLEG